MPAYNTRWFSDGPAGRAWRQAEEYVRTVLYPPKVTPMPILTTPHTRIIRKPDHIRGDLLLESKCGYQGDRARLKSEVDRDAELRFDGYLPVWLFFGARRTKSLGPSPALLDRLVSKNLNWVIHPV